MVGETNFDNAAERRAIGELTRALYRAISGPAGAARAWDTVRAFYADHARIRPFHLAEEGAVHSEVLTVEDYIRTRSEWFAHASFYEDETAHECAIEGRIAHVFSHYEARSDPAGKPFASGVNSIQLIRTQDGWRIISMTWRFTGVTPDAGSA